LDDNMGVGEIQQIRDANVPFLHFNLLFPHDELDWQLEVQYQDDATSHNNNRFSCRILLNTNFESRPVGTHCTILLQDCFCAEFPH